MSNTHPFPLSNNRTSYPSQDASPAYPSAPANSAYPYPSYPSRSAGFETGHGRVDPATTASISGMFHHQEDDPQHHYLRPGHIGDAYAQPHAHGDSREQMWQYSSPVTENFRPRFDQAHHDVGVSSDYQLPVDHATSPASPSHGADMATGVTSSSIRSGASGSSGGRSRREKPRLELAPDQPLTTQGKPRTRVYLACVQCRGRKIRCDGAKPICHNCSRRAENPQLCTYDTAPKRRGPDRVPGARQRSTGGPAEKPRRRRRLPPIDASGHTFESSQSASTSPVDYKTVSYSPTTHPYMPETAGMHQEGLTIIQQVGPEQFSRHRQGLPQGHGELGTHYSQSHDRTILPEGTLHSHAPAAGYDAIPLGSPLAAMPAAVGYAAGVPSSFPSRPLAQLAGEDDEYGESGEGSGEQRDAIAADPGLQFTRETWWDALLVLYATEGEAGAIASEVAFAMPPGMREDTTQSITADLRAIFRASPYWLNFINLPRFFGSLLDPRARHGIQPSLILGALALATFFRSHEGELGARGRDRALKLRDQAQAALEASLNSRWLDHSLVQAAWLIAFFEICAHPLHSTARVRSSMGMLDSLLRSLGLLSIDAEDPRVSIFTSGVPAVVDVSPRRLRQPSLEDLSAQPHAGQLPAPTESPPQALQQWQPDPPISPLSTRPLIPTQVFPSQYEGHVPLQLPEPQMAAQSFTAVEILSQEQSRPPSSACSCMSFTLGHTWPMVHEFAPLWDMTPTWQSQWTESEIRKEECRRLVWSSVMLTAGHSSYTAASPDLEVQQLFLMDPRNYALLFPGESLTYVDGAGDLSAITPPDKDSVWALYIRAMLMWNSCIRMRGDPSLPDSEKANFAMSAWKEIDAIEEALKRHSCGIERSFLFQGRELLFNCRMCIAYEFQRCLPQPTAHANILFYRRKANEWLTHLASLAKRVLNAGLPSVTGLPAASLAKRPFLLFWFMSQIERSLTLWSYDRSLTLALDVAKALSRPVEYLMSLWPCPEQRRRWEDLRKKLVSSCYAAGVPLSPSSAAAPQIQEIPVILTQ
ncbi:hypothetical protein PYCCODRAFT_1430448 [Trametes coccinea BRFM310]|uniref:Zn(2)-C6 fungal-type domain-containing protein n=1 Tax=Trametes coccinea (strain BRFM310) TaxID=1353009 RepID=A0A1Y2J4S1_TRAC3|nr:hypothetical protein PYCCODRAFT_1430448 [Trametes coccinea BRFM310]